MAKKLSVILFFTLFASQYLLLAQDVSFSQFYSNPLYLNPAFAGSIEVPRVALQYRNQWPGFSNAYKTYSLGFDLPDRSAKGGFGLFLMNDAQANSALNRIQADFMYSRAVRLNKKYKLRGAIQAGVHQNSLVWSKLIFPDNLDPSFGNHGVSQETPITDPNYTYFDVASGILLCSEKIFVGISGHHLNEPRQSYYEGQEDVAVLSRKFTLHAGAMFDIYKQGHLRKIFDLSPQIILQQQGAFSQINYGLFANRKGLTAGVWVRQNFGINYDAVIFLIGFMKTRWQLTYSYDYTISGLAGLTSGTSEISLSFLLKDPSKHSDYPFYRLPGEY